MTKKDSKKYDLEERTAKFGEEIINWCKKVPRNPINDPLVNQLVKAGTSVGANYCEADNAESKKDFKHKIAIVRKESRESKHFIRTIITAVPDMAEEGERLKQEALELNLIFNSIFKKVNN